jgi:UDP-glucose 4-epimerase
VNDLADAHIKALEILNKTNKSDVVNLGTGNGHTVNEVIEKAKEVTGRVIKSEIIERRPGDPDILVADNKKAKEVLGWIPKYDLGSIIETAWNWHKNQKY